MKLTEGDHQRIAEAIAAAEATTSGEIFCILARKVSDYRETPLAWAAGAALLLPPLVLLPLGFSADWLPGFGGGWTAGHAAALDASVGMTLSAYAVIQALVFALTALIVSIPPLRRALTPRSLRRHRVRRAAMEQFLAKGLHVTAARTGVLIFAALAERQVEIIADEGIYTKVAPEVWGDTVAALTRRLGESRAADGFIEAIQRSGEILAGPFPPGPENPNELPDRLVEL